ncbi:hypothetical protein K788_0006585 [Paraburkholderia caribensis MBA4]|uniref:Uncharacterized protein n=1 Tax=Paraburkholderia caribensis MBA4 TaxID=1323664 RepID=A0A0P0R888_9BURK|nr:hypothetical protein K788_0006585 [Paraburkholderia caribensis MBA4]
MGENANACPGVGVRSGKPFHEEDVCEGKGAASAPDLTSRES